MSGAIILGEEDTEETTDTSGTTNPEKETDLTAVSEVKVTPKISCECGYSVKPEDTNRVAGDCCPECVFGYLSQS